MAVIQQISLHYFKGFRWFDATMGHAAVLLGPNNAGKSTLVGAIRATSAMLRYSKWRVPALRRLDHDRMYAAYPLTRDKFDLEEENLRYEGLDDETRISLRFTDRSRLEAVWPIDDSPFFYLTSADQKQVTSTRDAQPAIRRRA